MITDGDDQQSYPLEAAAVAAERHVTIFTVGLGDADHGARVPQGAESQAYVEYRDSRCGASWTARSSRRSPSRRREFTFPWGRGRTIWESSTSIISRAGVVTTRGGHKTNPPG